MATEWVLCLGFLAPPFLLLPISSLHYWPDKAHPKAPASPLSLTSVPSHLRVYPSVCLHGTFHPVHAVGIQSEEVHVVKGALI